MVVSGGRIKSNREFASLSFLVLSKYVYNKDTLFWKQEKIILFNRHVPKMN